MNEIKLVIFDCDGVLVDSEIIGIKIEVELLRSAGCEVSSEELTERFCGMSWKDILITLEEESGLILMDKLLERTETQLDLRLPKEVEAIGGVRSALEGLQYPRCVCSNTKIRRLEAMLDKVDLRSFFGENVFSAKELGEGRSKPKPDIFLFGAQKMGCVPSQAVVIEDSVHGVQGAKAAGMRVIGFTGGSHTYRAHGDNLKSVGADLVIARMDDLPAALLDNRMRVQ